MESRRTFMKSMAFLGGMAAVGLPRAHAAAEKAETKTKACTYVASGKHELPPLPYAYDALEPYIDAQTLNIHHTKHHNGYVNGLNKAELALDEARKNNDFSKIKDLEIALAFHGSGHFNHVMYWTGMKPKAEAKARPEGDLAKMIDRDFGSFEGFLNHFSAATKSVEGNGWGALCYHPYFKKLYVTAVLNHQNMVVNSAMPILICDVWEHAYYLKYQNKRADYIAQWWNVVDWATVEQRFAKVVG